MCFGPPAHLPSQPDDLTHMALIVCIAAAEKVEKALFVCSLLDALEIPRRTCFSYIRYICCLPLQIPMPDMLRSIKREDTTISADHG